MGNKNLNLADFAREVLFKRLSDFLKEKEGVIRNRDIEYLHRMRVASRRLRIALWAFKSSFVESVYRGLAGQVKETTCVLGQARDIDTNIAFLDDLAKEIPDQEYREGILALRDSLFKKRQRTQGNIQVCLNSLDGERIARELDTALIKPTRENGHPKKKLLKLARKKINKRLKEFLEAAPDTISIKNSKQLHKLRIALKHLRYALENFDYLCHGKLKPYIKAAHDLQDSLGDFHNYDVWMRIASDFARRHARGDSNSLLPGIRYAQDSCSSRRDEAYVEFLRLWDKLQQERIWKKLSIDLEKLF
jgi:CHAD domain-containing protein